MTAPLAVYIHWPWCGSKCGYCDFNSHAAPAREDRWTRAVIHELSHFASETEGRVVDSVFFGGGTPSLADPGTINTLIDAVKARWSLAPDAEITLEANPTTAESGRFRGYHAAGVNRLSLGVQALKDTDLTFLGRTHSAAEARQAVAWANETFPRTSLDLIYARPGQTVEDWRKELAQALELGCGHLSAYQLGIEPGTRFHAEAVPEADEDSAVALFEATREVCDAAGLPAYEVSNHARPGAECRHNRHVWRGGDYLGVGPGAHGRLTVDGRSVATHQRRDPEGWLQAVERDGHATAGHRLLDAGERFAERVMLGLRLTEGLGPDLADRLDPARVAPLVAEGYLVRDRNGLRTTLSGCLCLNAVTGALLA